MSSSTWFRPADGAILDLDSLKALAAVPDRLLGAILRVTGGTGLVLEGLELDGEWASLGPPGTRRPEARSTEAVVSPGMAIVPGEGGGTVLVEVTEPVRVPWPTSAGPGVRGVLVVIARGERGQIGGGLMAARESVRAELGFVRPDQVGAPGVLPLASAVGNGRDWLTDLGRLYSPDHPAIEILLRRFAQLDQTIWKAEAEGSAWDRQVLGRNWVRYQTVAASALQAARMLLLTQTMTTAGRVRLLAGLYDQLDGSVQRAANELLQGIGRPESAGPYAVVAQRLEESPA